MTESQGLEPLRQRPRRVDPVAADRHEPAADAEQLTAILAALTATSAR